MTTQETYFRRALAGIIQARAIQSIRESRIYTPRGMVRRDWEAKCDGEIAKLSALSFDEVLAGIKNNWASVHKSDILKTLDHTALEAVLGHMSDLDDGPSFMGMLDEEIIDRLGYVLLPFTVIGEEYDGQDITVLFALVGKPFVDEFQSYLKNDWHNHNPHEQIEVITGISAAIYPLNGAYSSYDGNWWDLGDNMDKFLNTKPVTLTTVTTLSFE